MQLCAHSCKLQFHYPMKPSAISPITSSTHSDDDAITVAVACKMGAQQVVVVGEEERKKVKSLLCDRALFCVISTRQEDLKELAIRTTL